MADTKIHAVLLVPAEGDPHGLLREGPCGARPPMVWTLRCERCGDIWVPRGGPSSKAAFQAHRHHWERTGLNARTACRWQGPTALVLAWGGQPVPEGMDRLARCPAMKVGTILLLDADGREVSGG